MLEYHLENSVDFVGPLIQKAVTLARANRTLLGGDCWSLLSGSEGHPSCVADFVRFRLTSFGYSHCRDVNFSRSNSVIFTNDVRYTINQVPQGASLSTNVFVAGCA